MANVRVATERDHSGMVAMGACMAAESPHYKGKPYSPAKCMSVLGMFGHADDGLLLVAEQAGELVGMLIGMVTDDTFFNSRTASELIVYVRPDARGGSAAARLIRAFETWAIEQGADEIVLGVSTEVNAERTAQYYERLGYRPSGHTLRKHVRCA